MSELYRITCDPGIFSDPAAFCVAQRYWPEIDQSLQKLDDEKQKDYSRQAHDDFCAMCYEKIEPGLLVHHMQRQKGLQHNEIAHKVLTLYQDLVLKKPQAEFEIYIDRGSVGVSVIEEVKARLDGVDVSIVPIVITGGGDPKFGYDKLKRDKVLTVTRNDLLMHLQGLMSRGRINYPNSQARWINQLQTECTTLFPKVNQVTGHWTIAHRSKGSDDLAMALTYATAIDLLPVPGRIRSGSLAVGRAEPGQQIQNAIKDSTKQKNTPVKRRVTARMSPSTIIIRR